MNDSRSSGCAICITPGFIGCSPSDESDELDDRPLGSIVLINLITSW